MAKERTYIIKVIALSLRNNRIGKANEVVSERLLSSAPLELIEQGFIEEVLPNDNNVPEPESEKEEPQTAKEPVEEKKTPAKAKKATKSQKK